MRSILVAIAARILRVSRILRGNGTLTHYRGLRDDGLRGIARRGTNTAIADIRGAGSRKGSPESSGQISAR
jgi:hypothetical protein